MAEVSATNFSTASNKTAECIPTIDQQVFDLGCLGPALAIIFILAFLKRRKNLMLQYCDGYPGLVIPINFLGTFKDRFTIAATFGATATTCLRMFLDSKNGLFTLGGPAWVKVFQGLITVLVYGILFYPFFACLTTDYKLVGPLLGFLYAVLRFSFRLGIDFQCQSAYEGEARRLQYLGVLSVVPSYLCLLFIVIRFAVLLCLDVRKKWFQSSSNVNRAGETGSTCLVAGKPEIEHIKRLLNPGLNTFEADVKWYMRLLYFIYQPRPDFKFSTQLISTLVVAGIIIFQMLVASLSLLDVFKKQITLLCSNDTCKNVVEVFFGSAEAAFVVCSLFSVMLLLHFMKCHRKHVLQLYRGQRTFYQDVFVSPAKLVGRSLRFSGYQIAYTLIGYFVMATFLTIVCLFLGFVFKYMKNILNPAMLAWLKNVGEGMLPTVGMVVFLWLFQMFLAHFVFRDRDFPNITITVDNRRLFSILSYFFFFYNILLGLFSCFFRILKEMLLGVVFLSRIDRTSLMQGFQHWDPAFVAYLGFINVLVAHSHPVMLVFCQLLINRNKDRGLEDSLPRIPSAQQGPSEIRSAIGTRQISSYGSTVYRGEARLPRLSHKAFNRWHVAVTLLRNPSLIKYRRQGVVRPVVDLQRSINDDISTLI